MMAVPLTLAAQNNPYNIDDECYRYFFQADRLIAKEGFQAANDSLLGAALRKNDTKAVTLYYVERFKDLTARLKAKDPTTEEDDALVLEYMQELQDIATRNGFKQYYYYAIELAQNHFYNHGKFVRTMELVENMQRKALAENDDYGRWMATRYMVALYIDQNDFVSAKKYIIDALNLYHGTSDETLRKQSPSRLYCDLSNTYPVGNDSVPINLQKAIETSKQHLDTLRWQYHMAKLSAYIKDVPRYEEARDYCLSDPQLTTQISHTAIQMFKNIDALVYGKGGDAIDVSDMLSHLREVKYIANIAEEYGFEHKAFDIEKQLVQLHEKTLSRFNSSRVSELEARMGTDRLHADIDRKNVEINHLMIALAVAAFLILAVIAVLQIVHSRTLERRNRELMEANEKVLVANAAKTRFVQNMSHEVRTPLNAIVGFSQLLTLPDGTFSPEEKEEFSSHIINNTKMLTMLLDDILNTSSMDSGTYTIHYDNGECNFICEAAISSAEHRLQPGVSMVYTGGIPRPCNIWTDPRRVQQILINLLTNSCKHTNKGWIHLSCSLDENPGSVTFSVTDTGSGIPADQAEAIFDRFTKLNEFVQGTGLGLSICRDIASRMDARIYLDTGYTEGGSRFVLVIPIKQAPENPSNQ
ncbi:MAG: HAMP domain-containing histidine kinase [Bacteroidales bacterium]|nr:HAMP domain-containing histidine kinase [Bacteroidales bacterium]